MASVSLKNKVKGSALLYPLYYYIGSIFINIMRLFIRPQDNLVLFVSYGGKKFDDSPKDIYEAMKKDIRYRDFRLVWAFVNPGKFDIGGGEKIKIDTIRYYKTALQARVWITNVSINRGLKFKGINTLSINSWHGTAIKKIGEDSFTKDSFKSLDHSRRADIFLAQSQYDREVYSSAFRIPIDDVIITGFPRNDSLGKDNNSDKIRIIKQNLNIPSGKKVILYAPTYRDYLKLGGNNCYFEPAINLKRFETVLGSNYIFIIRAHIAVTKFQNIKENDFVKDYSNYPCLNDLLLVSDILISDYSGIIFDFSILGRPIICYTHDFDTYNEKRGMYFDIRKELCHVENEEDLIDSLINLKEDNIVKVNDFRKKYVQKFGDASSKVLDLICERINIC